MDFAGPSTSRSPDVWVCELCTFANPSRSRKCQMCMTVHSGSERQHTVSLSRAVKLQAEALTVSPFTVPKKRVAPTHARHRKTRRPAGESRRSRKKSDLPPFPLDDASFASASLDHDHDDSLVDQISVEPASADRFPSMEAEVRSNMSPELATFASAAEEVDELQPQENGIERGSVTPDSLQYGEIGSGFPFGCSNVYEKAALKYRSLLPQSPLAPVKPRKRKPRQDLLGNPSMKRKNGAKSKADRQRLHAFLPFPAAIEPDSGGTEMTETDQDVRIGDFLDSAQKTSDELADAVVKAQRELHRQLKKSFMTADDRSDQMTEPWPRHRTLKIGSLADSDLEDGNGRIQSPEIREQIAQRKLTVHTALSLGRGGRRRIKKNKSGQNSANLASNTWLPMEPMMTLMASTVAQTSKGPCECGVCQRCSAGDDSASFPDSTASSVSDTRDAQLDVTTHGSTVVIKRWGRNHITGKRQFNKTAQQGSSSMDVFEFNEGSNESEAAARSAAIQAKRSRKAETPIKRLPHITSDDATDFTENSSLHGPPVPSKPKFYVHRPLQPKCDPKPAFFENFLVTHDGVDHVFEEMILSDCYSSTDEEA